MRIPADVSEPMAARLRSSAAGAMEPNCPRRGGSRRSVRAASFSLVRLCCRPSQVLLGAAELGHDEDRLLAPADCF